MDEHDDTVPQQPSVTERQLRRLVVLAPSAYEANTRVDVIHETDLDLVSEGPE